MKKLLTKTMASIMLSSTMIAPITTNIMANETQVSITTAKDFVDILLKDIKGVDDQNYLTIVNSETTYNTLTGTGTGTVVNTQMVSDIDALVLANTGKTYQVLLTEAKAKQQAITQAAQQAQATQQSTQQNQTTQNTTQQTQTTQNTNQQAVQQSQTTTQQTQNVTQQQSTTQQTQTDSSQVQATQQTTQASSTQEAQSQQVQTNESQNTTTVTEDNQVSSEGKQEETSVQTEEQEAPIINQETKLFTGSANGVRVTVFAPAGAFEDGVEMKVVPLGESEALEDAKTVLGDQVDKAVSVDISFWKDGVEVEPSKEVSIQLASDCFAQGTQVSVIHDAGQGQVSEIGSTTNSDVTVSTSSFSPYTLASIKSAESQVLTSAPLAEKVVQENTTVESNEEKVTTSNALESTTSDNMQEKAYQVVTELQKTSGVSDTNTTAQAFIQTYLTSATGVIYTSATVSNCQNILNSKSAWEQLSQTEKISVNSILNNKIKKTYNKLLLEAQSLTSTSSSSSVRTSSATNIASYSVLLGTSVIGIISVMKKKEDDQ